MRTSLIAIVVLALGVFLAGYLIGQTRSAASSSAQAPTPAAVGGQSQPNRSFHDVGGGPAGLDGPHVHGRVTAINGNRLTISLMPDPGGDGASATTILLSGATQYATGPGGSSSGKGSIKAGSAIIASGTLTAGGSTLTAQQITLVSADGRFGPGDGGPRFDGPSPFGGPDANGAAGSSVSGTARAIAGTTLSIKPAVSAGGTSVSTVRNVVLTSSTTYSVGFGGAGRRADIKVGTLITAQGRVSSDGKTLTADAVRIATILGSGTGNSTAGSSL
jgi:hypothetical protein